MAAHRSIGVSWVLWGLSGLVLAFAALILFLVLSTGRAGAQLVPEPVDQAVSGVTGSPSLPGTEASVTSTAAGTLAPVADSVEPTVDPLIDTVTPIAARVVASLAALDDTAGLPTLGGPRSSPSAVTTSRDDGGLPPRGPSASATAEGTASNPAPVRPVAQPAAAVDGAATALPIAPPADPIPIPAPHERPTAPSNGADTTRVLDLLLVAIATTLAALVLGRGRRVLPFGAVVPRLALVSAIERPG